MTNKNGGLRWLGAAKFGGWMIPAIRETDGVVKEDVCDPEG
jgi:hypothetical protein